MRRSVLFIFAIMLAAVTMLSASSCSTRFSEVYYAGGDAAAENMLIFSGGRSKLLTEGLSANADNAVVSISMGVTEQGTYTVSGNTITFTFGEVTSSAIYNKATDTITWYGVNYIKPVPETTAASNYLY